MPSDDAGRFVCNYVYYHSLRFAEQHGIKSLFVHVPLFLTIDEEVQMHFVASLLEALARSTLPACNLASCMPKTAVLQI
uniref:Pyrrolidone-carboxylate peptidase n=1 Tax=Oryza nivara TaxID=4536 RepID=A0A0E0I4N3_ORYNI